MPLDPQIPLQATLPTIANPLQVMQQAQQLGLQREQMQALATERRAQTLKIQQDTDRAARENRAHTAFTSALQQGQGVPEASVAWARINAPEAIPLLTDYFNRTDETAAKIQELKLKSQQQQQELNNTYLDHVGRAADFVLTFAKDDPSKLQHAIGLASIDYASRFPDEKDRAAKQFQDLSALPPEQQQDYLTRVRAAAPFYQAQQAALMKPEKLNKGEQVVVPATGQVLAKNTDTTITGPERDERAQKLIEKGLKGPLTPDEQNELTAYKAVKLIGPEAAAAAAANRQSRSIDQQNAIQLRGQNFQVQQAGRSELTNKVEQPYLDAKEKASTLRSVIEAAKQGNMTAASVQSLMGTLGLVTMEGVKRINTTELQQVEGAGSLLERIKGSVGGLVSGQRMSPKIQQDLQDLGDILERSADKKYLQGWKNVTTRYGLTNEQPLVTPSGAPAADKAAGPADYVYDPVTKTLKKAGG